MCKGCGGGKVVYSSPIEIPVPRVGEVPLVLLQGIEIETVVYGSFTGTRYTVKEVMYVDLRDIPSLLKTGKVKSDTTSPSDPNKLSTIVVDNS